MNAEQGEEMSNHQTWAHIIRKSREWLRKEPPALQNIRTHMKAHKDYLDILRMEAR
jgi:hypothetical protein